MGEKALQFAFVHRRCQEEKGTNRFPADQLFPWQARRDSNPQPPDLESGALAVRATGLQEKIL